jgi:spermidine/putrescine transport system substrate-binding protein
MSAGYLEAMALALLRDGVVDVLDATDAQLGDAAAALREAVSATGVRFTADGAERGVVAGRFAAHQAWSGDVLAAPRYAAGGDRDGADQLRFWAPDGPGKVVGCDLMAVCERGRHPDLAHAFLNHLLDPAVALRNFAWNGYQPPVDGLSRDALSADPAWQTGTRRHLLDALLDDASFADAQLLAGFGPGERARWLGYWKSVAPET